MEIRKLIEQEREARIKLMRYAFETSRNTYDDLQPTKFPIDWYYGAFDNGKLAATAGIIPFDIRMRSQDFRMYGVGGVATKPEYRNQGIVRDIMVRMFQEMYEKNISISVLYPFKHSFYEMLGYRMVDEHIFYQFRISDIISKETSYYMKEVERINEEITTVYDKAILNFDYIAKRPIIDYWRAYYKNNYKFICYNGEQPVGYIIMVFPNKDYSRLRHPERTILIIETFWLNHIAKQTIFNFLWSHRDQRKYIAGGFPSHENIIDHLNTPRTKTRNIMDNSLLRIINIKSVLEKLQYPVENFTISFHIHDKFCPWNDGYFTLNSNEKIVEVEFVESSANIADIEVDIGYFAQLVAGFRTVEELLEFGFISINQDKFALLNNLFPKTKNFLHDFF